MTSKLTLFQHQLLGCIFQKRATFKSYTGENKEEEDKLQALSFMISQKYNYLQQQQQQE